MTILRKLVVPTLVTVTAVQYFRSSNPKPFYHEKSIQMVEIIDSFQLPGRTLTNAFRTTCYSLIDLVNPWSPINLMADAMNWVQVGGSGKWKLKQTAEALVLQLDVSGVAGEVKVYVEQNTDIDGPTNNTLLVEEHGVAGDVKVSVGHNTGVDGPTYNTFVVEDERKSILVNHPAVLIIEHKGLEDSSSSSRWLLDLPYNVYNNSAIKIEEKNKMLQTRS
ncbi:hypothetical protein M8C21_022876 [Ambrosia artemisiifolia]|uniref:Uncharacterized protein n=1 Tax=Ambrosia artemisiifolia TaxID=4212 RepID=A0AAD5CXS4_AMBAR|nr:hypothetical protein M8C21_022876 [Ambrosia artemisiifolia]